MGRKQYLWKQKLTSVPGVPFCLLFVTFPPPSLLVLSCCSFASFDLLSFSLLPSLLFFFGSLSSTVAMTHLRVDDRWIHMQLRTGGGQTVSSLGIISVQYMAPESMYTHARSGPEKNQFFCGVGFFNRFNG